MSQSVRAISVAPEFVREDPASAIRVLNEAMDRNPAELWLICVGPRDSAHRIMEALFMFGPAEEPIGDPSAPDGEPSSERRRR